MTRLDSTPSVIRRRYFSLLNNTSNLDIEATELLVGIKLKARSK